MAGPEGSAIVPSQLTATTFLSGCIQDDEGRFLIIVHICPSAALLPVCGVVVAGQVCPCLALHDMLPNESSERVCRSEHFQVLQV